MKRIATASALALGLVLVGTAAGAQDMQQKVAAVKQAAAANQQALHAYTWIEKTEILLKGEVKNTKLQSCQYGADGKVQKTLLSQPAAKEEGASRGGRQGRLKTKVVENKTGEMKEEMEAAAALVHQYVPPAPDKIQAAMAGGKITIVPTAGVTTIKIADYVKAGDSMLLAMDAAAKGLKQLNVDTWKDDPSDKVTLKVDMVSLPDGTSYAGQTLLSVPSSKVDVRITNSNHQKLVP